MKIKIGEHEFESSQVIEALTNTREYEVFTPDQINAKFGSLHQGYEDLISEITGLSKNNGEKGIDFVRRSTQALKSDFSTASEKIEELESLKKALEDKIKAGVGNDDLKKINEELIGKIETLNQEIEGQKTSFQKQLTERDNRDLVTSEISKIKRNLRANADKNGVQWVEDQIFSEALKHGIKTNDKGEVVLLNEHGVARTNQDLTPVTLSSYASDMFKDYTEKKKEPKGTGTGNPGQSEKRTLPTHIKSRVQLDEYLSSKESGIEEYSSEWLEMRKLGRELPLEEN